MDDTCSVKVTSSGWLGVLGIIIHDPWYHNTGKIPVPLPPSFFNLTYKLKNVSSFTVSTLSLRPQRKVWSWEGLLKFQLHGCASNPVNVVTTKRETENPRATHESRELRRFVSFRIMDGDCWSLSRNRRPFTLRRDKVNQTLPLFRPLHWTVR